MTNGMDWTEVTVKVAGAYAEDAAAVMQTVSSGIYIEDYRNLEEDVFEVSHIDLIDEALLNMDRENVKIHIYISALEDIAGIIGFIRERLDELSFYYELDIGKIRDEDWANNWKQYYKPFEVGKRLLVRPEWEQDYNAGERLVLSIEPGLAFGTGTHESTKMCLELIEDCVSGGEKILDIGCGTGILSIAALLLGACSATAIDIDPIAVKAAGKNAALNGIDTRLRVIEGDLVSKLQKDEAFDIITANIVADVIIGLSATISEYMKDGSVFICSGIIDDKLGAVVMELEKNGFTIEKVCEEKGWAAILAKQKR